MTMRITIGFDPGNTGAIAVLTDGVPVSVFDMPTIKRKAGNDVDPYALALTIKGILREYVGAHVVAIVEHVAMRPGNARGTDQQAGIGVGVIRGVLGAVSVPRRDVYAQVWKRHHGLLKQDKNASRVLAVAKWPQLVRLLARVKDHGRAEAALIAEWGYANEIGL